MAGSVPPLHRLFLALPWCDSVSGLREVFEWTQHDRKEDTVEKTQGRPLEEVLGKLRKFRGKSGEASGRSRFLGRMECHCRTHINWCRIGREDKWGATTQGRWLHMRNRLSLGLTRRSFFVQVLFKYELVHNTIWTVVQCVRTFLL